MEDKDKYINYIVENIKRYNNNLKLKNIYFYFIVEQNCHIMTSGEIIFLKEKLIG